MAFKWKHMVTEIESPSPSSLLLHVWSSSPPPFPLSLRFWSLVFWVLVMEEKKGTVGSPKASITDELFGKKDAAEILGAVLSPPVPAPVASVCLRLFFLGFVLFLGWWVWDLDRILILWCVLILFLGFGDWRFWFVGVFFVFGVLNWVLWDEWWLKAMFLWCLIVGFGNWCCLFIVLMFLIVGWGKSWKGFTGFWDCIIKEASNWGPGLEGTELDCWFLSLLFLWIFEYVCLHMGVGW